jgi:hypothetical protein
VYGALRIFLELGLNADLNLWSKLVLIVVVSFVVNGLAFASGHSRDDISPPQPSAADRQREFNERFGSR